MTARSSEMACFAARAGSRAVPITALDADGFADWARAAPASRKAWADANGFRARSGETLLLPGPDNRPAEALLGLADEEDLWSWGAAASGLPTGTYALPQEMSAPAREAAALGWALGAYRFDRYKKTDRPTPRLAVGDKTVRRRAEAVARGVYLARDLITTPASDMGPAELETAAGALADRHGAKLKTVTGEALLARNFPMIHAVGRASTRAPRLIELVWGKPRRPTLVLVGKGVCFDSGGLDLKPASAMKLMKKDMGGAGLALGLAAMIMETGLDLGLRVLIPAVENAVAGNAFRPMDVLTSRKGLTVEIGNTDAEGRLVLADALTYAQEKPADLVIDFATLTGAARVALGTELPALFCNDDEVAAGLLAAARAARDPIWRLPLHKPYASQIEPKHADLTNAPDGGYGGAITAALFLERFIENGVPWAHFDVMAWTLAGKPGRPEGGEGQAIRAVFRYLESRYGQG